MIQSNDKESAGASGVASSDLLEYAVDLEIYDTLSNSRVEKLDVILAKSESDAIAEVRWKYGETAEVQKIDLF